MTSKDNGRSLRGGDLSAVLFDFPNENRPAVGLASWILDVKADEGRNLDFINKVIEEERTVQVKWPDSSNLKTATWSNVSAHVLQIGGKFKRYKSVLIISIEIYIYI